MPGPPKTIPVLQPVTPAGRLGRPGRGILHQPAPPTRDRFVQLTPPGYRDLVLFDQPAVYWRLGEAAGTVAVDEVNHNAHPGTYPARA